MTPSLEHYYHDGKKCEIYEKIFEYQQGQWPGNRFSSIQVIIEEVAEHKPRLRGVDEVEEFPEYCDPEIPYEIDSTCRVEIEEKEQFEML